MRNILGVEIPESFDGLGPDELKALGDALRDAAKSRLAASRAEGASDADKITPAVLAEIEKAREVAGEVKTLAETKLAEQAQFEADVAAAEAALADEDEDGNDADSDSGDEGDADGDEDGDEGDEPAAVTASWSPSAAAAGGKAKSDEAPPATRKSTGTYADAGFKAAMPLEGMGVGEEFTSFKQLGKVLAEVGSQVRGASGPRITVAKLEGHFEEAQILRGNDDDIEKLGGLDPLSPKAASLVAALCAPAEPTYDLATTSSLVRPFKGSLATYNPRRGRVSVYPTPKLADIEDGRGIWTAANDANPSAEKEACATIACADPITYTIYGVYRCLTVKNMLAMTFPELVEAYLNRLGAVTASLAETTMFEAAVASANTINVSRELDTELGGSGNLLDTLLLATSIYREEERYGDQQFDAWGHRWILTQLKRDIARQRRTSGRFGDRLPSTAEVNAVLADAGIDITWTYEVDDEWQTPDALTVVDGAADLPELPCRAQLLIAPKGNLRALDKGELTIGVAPGNIYRDNDSNTRNEFTIFQENFEGLMDMGATNWALDLDAFAPSGVQTPDASEVLVCAGS